jgi:hypothetical protein
MLAEVFTGILVVDASLAMESIRQGYVFILGLAHPGASLVCPGSAHGFFRSPQ